MPYRRKEDLPSRVRAHLPAHAQDIWRAAFNAAWQAHLDDPDREEIAPRIAWAAVKLQYHKQGETWVPLV